MRHLVELYCFLLLALGLLYHKRWKLNAWQGSRVPPEFALQNAT
jgi:hypothetical protein